MAVSSRDSKLSSLLRPMVPVVFSRHPSPRPSMPPQILIFNCFLDVSSLGRVSAGCLWVWCEHSHTCWRCHCSSGDQCPEQLLHFPSWVWGTLIEIRPVTLGLPSSARAPPTQSRIHTPRPGSRILRHRSALPAATVAVAPRSPCLVSSASGPLHQLVHLPRTPFPWLPASYFFFRSLFKYHFFRDVFPDPHSSKENLSLQCSLCHSALHPSFKGLVAMVMILSVFYLNVVSLTH